MLGLFLTCKDKSFLFEHTYVFKRERICLLFKNRKPHPPRSLPAYRTFFLHTKTTLTSPILLSGTPGSEIISMLVCIWQKFDVSKKKPGTMSQNFSFQATTFLSCGTSVDLSAYYLFFPALAAILFFPFPQIMRFHERFYFLSCYSFIFCVFFLTHWSRVSHFSTNTYSYNPIYFVLFLNDTTL